MVVSDVFLFLLGTRGQVLVLEVFPRTEVERELHHGALVHLVDQRIIGQAVTVHVRSDSVGSVQSGRNQLLIEICVCEATTQW